MTTSASSTMDSTSTTLISSTTTSNNNNNNNNDASNNTNNNNTNNNNNNNGAATAEYWFVEDIAPGLKIQTVLHNMVVKTQSKFQSIEVLDTYFGRTLITDGKSQSSAFDEYAYHETLVHPAMVLSSILMNHQNNNNNNNNNDGSSSTTTTATTMSGPRTVLIGGGGELATAREVLRWKSVERVVMVDLDGMLVDICQEHLPSWGGAQVMQDERFTLIIGDAYQYVMDMADTFDVIIMDISDPIEIGPGIMLYVKEFYQHVVTRLTPSHGVFVTQAGVAESIPLIPPNSNISHTSCFAPIRNTLQTVFDHAVPYSSNIPSFGGDWGFVCAYNNNNNDGGRSNGSTSHGDDNIPTDTKNGSSNHKTMMTRMMDLPSHVVDEILESHVKGEMRLYDGITHARLFHLTKPVRKSLEADPRIMTKDDPIFMY